MSHKTRSWSQSLKQLLDSAKEKNNMLDYSEMIESLIITGVIDGTKTVSEEYMSEFYQHCMKNESVLMFNTDLILSYNENITKEFSEEDYEQEIKKSTICI